MAVKKRLAVNTARKTARKQGGKGKPFGKGISGNPAGRPIGSRNRLSEDVFRDFSELWSLAKLKKLAAEDPATFIKLAVSLIPKQVQVDGEQVLWVMSDRPISNDEWEAKWASDDPVPKAPLGAPRRPAKRAP